MPSLGASAHGSEESPLVTPTSPMQNAHLTDSTENKEKENAKLTDSDRKVTPVSPSQQVEKQQQSAKLTFRYLFG